MKSLWKRVIQSTLVVGIAASLTGSLIAQDPDPVGIVRISRPRSADAVNRVMPVSAMMEAGSCNALAGAPGSAACDPSSAGGTEYVNGRPRRCFHRHGNQGWQSSDWQGSNGWSADSGSGSGAEIRGHWRGQGLFGHYDGYGQGDCPPYYNHAGKCQAMCDYFKCKFGYFIPSGGDGSGIPWAGHYTRVYPVNPYYNDSRDGQVWAAQGYGIPLSVPLAPVVGHTYEYGWGVPSSRLVPVSHPAY